MRSAARYFKQDKLAVSLASWLQVTDVPENISPLALSLSSRSDMNVAELLFVIDRNIP
jgi:hypothetical protein